MTSAIRTLTNALETKVVAGAAGAGLGGVLTSFVVWLLGVLIWHASSSALDAGAAITSVPTPVSLLVGALLTAVLSFVAGYRAPHTSRAPGAHSTDSATPASVTPGDLTSAPVQPEPIGSTVLAGQPPNPPTLTAGSLLNVPTATRPDPVLAS